MHALNSVFALGDTTSPPQQDVDELITVPNIHGPFSLAVHANGKARGPQKTDSSFGFCQRHAHHAFHLLSVVAITLLLLNMFFCRLKKGKNVQFGERVRRLAREEDGKEGEDKAGSKVPELCELLEAAVTGFPEGESAGAGATSRQEEKPRKRKRKMKWLEGAAQTTKIVKPGKRSIGCFML